VAEKQEKVLAIHKLLFAEYGPREWQSRLDPLSELTFTILSQNTNDTNRDRAIQLLKERFPTWEEVRDAPVEEVAETIRIGGLSNIKARRIKAILEEISWERGELSLDFLRHMEMGEALKWLQSLNGVGPKTAACVLLFSLRKPAFPVDTHIYRVAKRLGLLEEGASREEAHQALGNLVPPEATYDLHLNMIAHGRQICQARQPRCEVCVLKEHCNYYARRFLAHAREGKAT